MTPQGIVQRIVSTMKHAGSLVTKLKEKRFTSTARVLGEEKALGVNVLIVDQPNGGAAWWNSTARQIVLNDAVPATTDSKLMLVWERAKLFHELFHILFTTNDRLRKDLCYKSNNQDRYLWVSNALEDGRIEYFGGKLFAGTTWYIRTLLSVLVHADTPDSGLLLYIRTRLWRNAKEQAYWSKYQTLIDECITAKSSDVVWRNAFDIVQDMEKPQPKQPPQQPPSNPQPPSDDEGGEGNPQPQPSDDDQGEDEDESESGEGESNDDDSDDESGEGESNDDGSESDDEADDDESDEDTDSEAPDADSDDEDTEEGQDSGESSNEAGKPDTTQETPSQPPTPHDADMDEDVENELRQMVEDALAQVEDEVNAELIEIDREAADYVVEQEYANADEERVASDLTEIFASMLVESKRQRFQSCKYGGKLDTKRLLNTRTGGEFMHERVEKASQPHIVLLLDLSYSMYGQLRELTEAARVLNGAIQASGAKSIAFTFGAYEGVNANQVDAYSTIPKETFNSGYGTPTHAALIAAREWLNDEQAKRGMVIVITDGHPKQLTSAQARFQDLSNEGYYVLNVLLGMSPQQVKNMETMCHDYVCIEGAHELVRELEVPIGNFMSGAF